MDSGDARSSTELVELQRYDDVVLKMRQTLIQRHNNYGHTNLSKFGLDGLIVRMADKQARLEKHREREIFNRVRAEVVRQWSGAGQIVAEEADRLDTEYDYSIDESVRDVFMDLANYAIIGVLMLDGAWPE